MSMSLFKKCNICFRESINLKKCDYCNMYFCDKHIKPKILQNMVKGGHPCVEYTLKLGKELDSTKK